ncbi:hypothetical protein FQA39_LY05246 [Lamprigera yunnana]|nr:hypothetical protein FQA39_LY05246 [Lamprigera yunnana]
MPSLDDHSLRAYYIDNIKSKVLYNDTKIHKRRPECSLKQKVAEQDEAKLSSSTVTNFNLIATYSEAEINLHSKESQLEMKDIGNEVKPIHDNYVPSKFPPVFHPEGRPLVALDYFLQQILSAQDYGNCGCTITDMLNIQLIVNTPHFSKDHIAGFNALNGATFYY